MREVVVRGRRRASVAPERGTPIGRRVILGILGMGAAGVVVGKSAQNGLSSLLAPLQRVDPTGLSNLLPGNYFRIYTVTVSYTHLTLPTNREV